MPRSGFDVAACTDLGRFDPRRKDYGLDAFLNASGTDVIVVMEDRQPDFFTGFQAYDPEANVPLNRHGPRTDAWTQRDLRGFVEAAHARNARVILGFWIHECDFVDKRHPELLMTSADGSTWREPKTQSADFNPIKRMRADPELGIEEGTRFADYVAHQYRKLHGAFGFDGLFLGDGGMGFRQFGDDGRGARHFDFSAEWLNEFIELTNPVEHEGCTLRNAEAPTAVRAKDILHHHWQPWLEWNIGMWTTFYATTAHAVHATGGELWAYNVMNFGPALARLHAADYRALAQAGLDVLVFQTYDYAWGPHGPFKPRNKHLEANLQALLRTKAYVADTPMKVYFTTETADTVEKWRAPISHTLGEVYAYGHARVQRNRVWQPAADGTFVVWASDTPDEHWSLLHEAFARVRETTPEPAHAITWCDDDARCLEAHPWMEGDDLYGDLALDARGHATHITHVNHHAAAAPVPPARDRRRDRAMAQGP